MIEVFGGLIMMFVFYKILNKAFNFVWDKFKKIFGKKGE